MKQKFLILSAVLLCSVTASALTPKERIYGAWRLEKIKGMYCANQISDLEYYFSRDGRYEVRAVMNRLTGKSDEVAKGTYVADDRTITAFVEEHTMGPHSYRFEGASMVMVQNPPGCEIYLSREDE